MSSKIRAIVIKGAFAQVADALDAEPGEQAAVLFLLGIEALTDLAGHKALGTASELFNHAWEAKLAELAAKEGVDLSRLRP